MNMNISTDVVNLADAIRLIGQPVRIQILLILENDPACVCHMEAVTGIRQAAISQQLTILRNAGLVQAAREGRNIFYSLSHPDIIQSINNVATVLKISQASLAAFSNKPLQNCPCPRCNPEMDPVLACKKLR
jgi:DNA-binding transcriptional ArsR family regulator